MTENVKLPEDHKQVCVWPGTEIEEDQVEDFENWILGEFDTRIKYLETIVTKPDKTGPGGRMDVFFSIHNDDIAKFIGPKMQIEARWVEDVLANGNNNQQLYPKRVMKYMCWNPNDDTEEEAEANTYKICNSCAAGEKKG
jgi:hypothetical protein